MSETHNETTPAPAEKPAITPVLRGFKRQHLKPNLAPAQGLLEIFSWMRPHKSDAEEEFIHLYIDSLGAQKDAEGNRWIKVDGDDKTLWSCHTDTVHHKDGYQRLEVTRGNKSGDFFVGVHARDGSCLGADDGTGVWMLLEMIKAKVPGLYVFHRGEEKGCIGSRWIAANNAGFLKGIERAIAFDRRDYDNVITKQCGTTCCSDEFAKALSAQLGMGYKPDPTGMFTDTAQYVKHVAECTNLSVGYGGAHGPLEYQNITHALKLREAVLALKPAELPAARDPHKVEAYGGGGYHHVIHNRSSAGHNSHGGNLIEGNDRGQATIYASQSRVWKGVDGANIKADLRLSMFQLVKKYPFEVTALLRARKITEDDILFQCYGNEYFNYMESDT